MSLTLFFIVEPNKYQFMACYLAASIREYFPQDVQLVGYCPAHLYDDLDPAAVETLRRLRCEVRSMQTEGVFDPPYPHGNKILACLEPRDTEYSGFVDSDVLMIRENSIENLIRPDHVSASVAGSMHWAPKGLWDAIYARFPITLPQERVMLMRDHRGPVVPYYSSGLVVFPEGHKNADGKSFPQVWMDAAQTIDAIDDLRGKRPYLDQMSLPIAIRLSGLTWHELPEDQHYIMGGADRRNAVPKDEPIFTVHYRQERFLEAGDLSHHRNEILRMQVGHRRVSKIWLQDLPAGIAPPPGA